MTIQTAIWKNKNVNENAPVLSQEYYEINKDDNKKQMFLFMSSFTSFRNVTAE